MAPDGGLSGLRVLAIDDYRDSADVLAVLLKRWGCACEVSYSSADGIQRAATFEPHVVLLDLGLPEMDGYLLASRIVEQAGRVVPVLIAVTGYGAEADRQRVRQAGFAMHLVKPVGRETLRKALKQVTADEYSGRRQPTMTGVTDYE